MGTLRHCSCRRKPIHGRMRFTQKPRRNRKHCATSLNCSQALTIFCPKLLCFGFRGLMGLGSISASFARMHLQLQLQLQLALHWYSLETEDPEMRLKPSYKAAERVHVLYGLVLPDKRMSSTGGALAWTRCDWSTVAEYYVHIRMHQSVSIFIVASACTMAFFGTHNGL